MLFKSSEKGKSMVAGGHVRDFFDTKFTQFFDTFLLHSVGWRGSEKPKHASLRDRTPDNRMWLGFLRLGSRSQSDRVGSPFDIQKLGVGPEATLGLQ